MGRMVLEIKSGSVVGMGYSLHPSQGLQKCDVKAESDLQAFKQLECLKLKVGQFF